jgi:hydrogenase maturation protease
MTEKTILVLGVGNILLSDEGVGVHAVRLLRQSTIPDEVEVVDGGTGGFELVPFAVGKEKIVIIDAIRADATAGSIFRFATHDYRTQRRRMRSAHDGNIDEVIDYARGLSPPPEIIVYGVVVQDIANPGLTLSPSVQSVLAPLVEEICLLLDSVCSKNSPCFLV